MVARIPTLLLTAVVMQHAIPVVAQTAPDPIRYTLSFPEPHTHYVEVTAVVPTARRPQVELMMAVWTPGSYLGPTPHIEVVAGPCLVDRPAQRLSGGGRASWGTDCRAVLATSHDRSPV